MKILNVELQTHDDQVFFLPALPVYYDTIGYVAIGISFLKYTFLITINIKQ